MLSRLAYVYTGQLNRILAFTTTAAVILTLSLGIILPNAGTGHATVPRIVEASNLYLKNGLGSADAVKFSVEYCKSGGLQGPPCDSKGTHSGFCNLVGYNGGNPKQCGPNPVPIDTLVVITIGPLPSYECSGTIATHGSTLTARIHFADYGKTFTILLDSEDGFVCEINGPENACGSWCYAVGGG